MLLKNSISILLVKPPYPFAIHYLVGYLLREVDCERDKWVLVCYMLKMKADTPLQVTSATRFLRFFDGCLKNVP